MEEEVVSVLRRNGAAIIGFSSGRGITVPAAMLAEIPLSKGTRADPDEIAAKTAEKAGAYCLRQVLLWQARRDHASEEMKRRLVMMGYPSGAADEALEQLKKCGAVSDRRCCESLVRSKKRRRGREGLMMEMRARGVDAETAAAALESEMDEAEEARSALRQAAEMLRRGKDREKVFLGLRRRGYSRSLCVKALEEALRESAEDGEENIHQNEILWQE